MNFRYIKIMLLTGIVLMSISACKSQLGTWSEVKKSVVFPGVEEGSKYMVYTADFKVLKPLKINKINLLLPDKSLEIKDYKIIDKKAGIILPGKKIIPAGDYRLKADLIYSEELAQKGDQLQIHLQSETGKTFIITAPVIQGEIIMRM